MARFRGSTKPTGLDLVIESDFIHRNYVTAATVVVEVVVREYAKEYAVGTTMVFGLPLR